MGMFYSKLEGGKGINPFKLKPSLKKMDLIFDHISVTHILEFCKPIPSVQFDISNEPPRTLCYDYNRDLKDYPLNKYTYTNGTLRTFGNSEMVLTLIKLIDYPRSGGYITITYYRPDGSEIYKNTSSVPSPNPDWTFWNYWSWSCIGKFDNTGGSYLNEILTPGYYTVKVDTSWGISSIGYTVINTECVPNWTCDIPFNGYENDGCGNTRINDNCIDTTITISNVQATLVGSEMRLTWNQNIDGIIKILFNDLYYIQQGLYPAGANHYIIDNFDPQDYKFCVQGTNKVCITGSTLPTTGSILCNTAPVGASITIDRVLQSGVTPIEITNLTSGNHTVLFKLSGYQDCTKTITVIAGMEVSGYCALVVSTPADTYGCVNGICTPNSGNLPAGCNNTCSSVTPKYDCSFGVCIRNDVNGIYLEPTCGGTCSSIKCIPLPDEYYISGIGCIKKIYTLGAGGLVALMLLKK